MRNFTRTQIKEIQKKFDLKGTEIVRVTRSFRVRVNLFLGCTVPLTFVTVSIEREINFVTVLTNISFEKRLKEDQFTMNI